MKLKAQWLAVEQIVDRWRIDDEWWREKPISRAYYQILAEDGRGYTLFHDLANERWYRQGHA